MRSATKPLITNSETFSSSTTSKIRISQTYKSRRCELSPHECYMKFHSGPDVLRPPKLSQSGGAMGLGPCRSFYDLRQWRAELEQWKPGGWGPRTMGRKWSHGNFAEDGKH